MVEDGGDTARWPVGPRYSEWVQADGAPAWVKYKLRSADWYIDRLEEVGSKVGFDRYIGVEMAVDGALAALTAAYDASIRAVIKAVEMYEEQAVQDGRSAGAPPPVSPRDYSWQGRKRNQQKIPGAKAKLKSVANEIRDINVESVVADVGQALRSKPSPGWLKALQDLRNAVIHHDTLARHIHVRVGGENPGTTWGLQVAGESKHPVLYLRTASQQMAALTGQLLEVCELLCPNGFPTPRPN